MEIDISELQRPYAKIIVLWLECRGEIQNQETMRDLLGASKGAVTDGLKELRGLGLITLGGPIRLTKGRETKPFG
jgi:Mn-dependent DtxR family transcriptional regulator